MHHTANLPGGKGPSLLEAALGYAARGWSIIPIRSGTKRPACRSWAKFRKTQPDQLTLERWFGHGRVRGLAVVCSKVSGGLVCRDFDTMDSCRELRRAAGNEPFCLACRTAGELLEVNHTTASRWLFLLAHDRVIEVAENGGRATRRAGRFRYRGD